MLSKEEELELVQRRLEGRLNDLEGRLRQQEGSQPCRSPGREPVGSPLKASALHEEVEPPFLEVQRDLDTVKEALHSAVSAVRVAESSMRGQLSDYADQAHARLEAVRRSGQQTAEELQSRAKELSDARERLDATCSQLDAERTQAEAHQESHEALLVELEKANHAVGSAGLEHRQLQEQLEETRHELVAKSAEMSAAKTREDELEERLASLRRTELALREQLEAAQGELAKNERDLREELRQVQSDRDLRELALREQLEAARGELAKNERDLREELSQLQEELGEVRAKLAAGQACCLFRPRGRGGAPPAVPTRQRKGSFGGA